MQSFHWGKTGSHQQTQLMEVETGEIAIGACEKMHACPLHRPNEFHVLLEDRFAVCNILDGGRSGAEVTLEDRQRALQPLLSSSVKNLARGSLIK